MKKVCGLDVPKDTIFLCILAGNGQTFLKEYSTLTPDIEAIRDLIKEQQVREVAMESTGIYWIPVWRILQGHVEMRLVNPYFIKQLPGRKTDVKDAQWIATVLQKGLIRGSYIPEKHIQELRQFERRYVRLCEQKTQIEQEIDRQLHRCKIRITSFTTKIGSVSVMGVVQGLINGENTAEELIKHVHGQITNKHKEKIIASLVGWAGLRPRNDESAKKIKSRKITNGNKYLAKNRNKNVLKD
jgi:transposase